MKLIHLFFSLTSGLLCGSAMAQQASPSQEDHFAGVDARGDQGMGFSHERTTHHFHLFSDGGSIEIASNDAADAESQKAIRDHLSMIAERFSQGDFAIPMFIHAAKIGEMGSPEEPGDSVCSRMGKGTVPLWRERLRLAGILRRFPSRRKRHSWSGAAFSH